MAASVDGKYVTFKERIELKRSVGYKQLGFKIYERINDAIDAWDGGKLEDDMLEVDCNDLFTEDPQRFVATIAYLQKNRPYFKEVFDGYAEGTVYIAVVTARAL